MKIKRNGRIKIKKKCPHLASPNGRGIEFKM